MKIAITGHSAGIGKALADAYASRGHEIIGLSRRIGFNIRSLHKILHMIEPCDMLINNAQVGFAQTELLFAVYESWLNAKDKTIINISTMMTSHPYATIPGIGMDAYRVQKLALEEAHRQLRFRYDGPKMLLVRPGAVATQPDQYQPQYADPSVWAERLVKMIELAGDDLELAELSLGVNYHGS